MYRESNKIKSIVTKDSLMDAFRASNSGYQDMLLSMAPETTKTGGLSVMAKLKERRDFLKNQNPGGAKIEFRDTEKPTVAIVDVKTLEPVVETKLKVLEPIVPVKTGTELAPISILDSDDENEIKSSSSDSETSSSEDDVSDEDSAEFISLNEQNYGFTRDNVPWITKKYDTGHSNLDLHEEIIEFYNFMQPTESEKSHREQTIKMIKDLVYKINPEAKVAVFGSYAVDLMMPGSDLDFNVTIPEKFGMYGLNVLQKIADKLIPLCEPGSVEFLKQIRVPIIRFIDKATGQHGDITYGSGGEVAIETIKKYTSRYPAFKYLATVLKYFVKQRGINEVYHGGISSFSMTLLLISMLQMHTSNYDATAVPTTSLGSLLIDFLALYGEYFNYHDVAIEVTAGGKYRRKNGDEMRKDFDRLVIIDPNDNSNNVSGGSRYIDDVLKSFKYAF